MAMPKFTTGFSCPIGRKVAPMVSASRSNSAAQTSTNVRVESSMLSPPRQIEDRVDEYPDHVYQMPIEPDHFDRDRPLRQGRPRLFDPQGEPEHEQDPDREVDRM